MAKQTLSEQLDQIVQRLLDRRDSPALKVDRKLAPLREIAADLRDLPRDEFRLNLQSELHRRSSMASKAVAVPEALQTATPYLSVSPASDAIDFYKKAFGAVEVMRLTQPDGRIGHAEIRIGNSSIMLADEFPDYGFLGPKSLGGSPVKMHIYVDDVDARARQAVAAGAQVVRPVADQFYGERSGQFADPFGYTWILSTRKEIISAEEVQRRFDTFNKQTADAERGDAAAPSAVRPVPEAYRTITPYLIAQDAAQVIDFVKQSFGAVEAVRSIGSAGGIHCEVRLGPSRIMIGGGGPGLKWSGESMPAALHIYVPDVDEAYERALQAGAVSLQEPGDRPYGEYNASVKDAAGNHWHIGYPTRLGAKFDIETAQRVQVYLYPLRAEPVIAFLKRAFGAEELERHATPEGVVMHAAMKIGDSTLELGEAKAEYQPMPTMFYLEVPNVDALYNRAVQAGASAVAEPKTQPYGARVGTVKDVFGNTWYIAGQIIDARA